jgi:hypothetical protein
MEVVWVRMVEVWEWVVWGDSMEAWVIMEGAQAWVEEVDMEEVEEPLKDMEVKVVEVEEHLKDMEVKDTEGAEVEEHHKDMGGLDTLLVMVVLQLLEAEVEVRLLATLKGVQEDILLI